MRGFSNLEPDRFHRRKDALLVPAEYLDDRMQISLLASHFKAGWVPCRNIKGHERVLIRSPKDSQYGVCTSCSTLTGSGEIDCVRSYWNAAQNPASFPRSYSVDASGFRDQHHIAIEQLADTTVPSSVHVR